jgi:LysM repeat protein
MGPGSGSPDPGPSRIPTIVCRYSPGRVGGDTSVIDMTTESRPGRDTGVGEEMRRIAATAKVRTTTVSSPPAAPARSYTVKSGDTLWDIAVNHYGDGRQYRKIASANNIADPNHLDVGRQLTIPQ